MDSLWEIPLDPFQMNQTVKVHIIVSDGWRAVFLSLLIIYNIIIIIIIIHIKYDLLFAKHWQLVETRIPRFQLVLTIMSTSVSVLEEIAWSMEKVKC